MELRNAKKDENEKTLEASVVENEKTLEASVVENDKDAGKDGKVVVEAEAEKNENEVVETSAGEKGKEGEKSVETSVDAVSKEPSVLASVEENKTENGTVKEPSVLASVDASSSGMEKPKGLLAKKKIVKKVKKLVKKKLLKGTAVQVAGEENVTVEQGIKKDEKSAEPSFSESEKETKKVVESVADSPQCSSGKEKDSETSLGEDDMESMKELEEFAEAPADDDEKVAGAEPSGEKTLKEVKGKASALKSVGKRLLKGQKVKGNLAQGPKEGDTGASPGGNVMEAVKAIEVSVEAPEKALSVQKKLPKKLRGNAKIRKTPAAPLAKNEADKGTPQLEKNNNSLVVNEQSNGVEKSHSLDVNTNEGGQQKNVGKTGLAEGKRRKRKRGGNKVVDSNKKQRNEVVAAGDVTQQRVEEGKKQLVDPEKREMAEQGKVKIAGLIFMCNAKTRPDCFRFSIMGVQEKRKDYVMSIKPGIKLFLYDYDLKLLYGIFQASSAGGMKLERNAFGGSFPAQVRFKVVSDCIPLPESKFKNAIKENYNNKNKFKTELTRRQVFKLIKLFRPAPLPAQLTHTLPILVRRDVDGERFDRDRYAPGSSRTHLTRTHERSHNPAHASPPPRREEPPRDLYLSEREYRTYGLRRGETTQHHPIPPPDSSYRDRVPLDSYRPSVDHERLLRHAEMERHDRREVRFLHLPERDYHPYDHLSSRREILARNSPEPPASAVNLDSYRRDPYYRYEYRSPERPSRTYLAPSGREDDDLYSRYVTVESLAEYYRSSRSRYPDELPPSSVTSRYVYSGSLPYSHR